MSEHKRQTVTTRDGTLMHIEWTRSDKFQAAMVPGETFYKAVCEQHGLIDSSYEGLSVGFAVDRHGREYHGGVIAEVEIVDLIRAEEGR